MPLLTCSVLKEAFKRGTFIAKLSAKKKKMCVLLSDCYQGRIQRFRKGGALFVGHHDWPTKKFLGFRWSKKVKITLQTKAFGETFLSVF